MYEMQTPCSPGDRDQGGAAPTPSASEHSAAAEPLGPAVPVEPFRGSAAYLARVRDGLRRLTPAEAHAAQQAGSVIIDTRTSEQRAATANIPGAIVIDRTVLEWRLDPSNAWRIPEATSWETQYLVVCRHGYSSSVAAKALQDVGLVNATDIVGGFDAWAAAGLPTTQEPADVRE